MKLVERLTDKDIGRRVAVQFNEECSSGRVRVTCCGAVLGISPRWVQILSSPTNRTDVESKLRIIPYSVEGMSIYYLG